MSKTFLFQAIRFSQTVQIQTIQSHKYAVSSIYPIDRAQSGATIPEQSGPGGDCNEGILRIPQSFSITGTSPSDCLVSYAEYSLWQGSYPSVEVQSVDSTAPADWAKLNGSKNCYVLPIIQFRHLVNEFQYCYLTLIILFKITYLFAHS